MKIIAQPTKTGISLLSAALSLDVSMSQLIEQLKILKWIVQSEERPLIQVNSVFIETGMITYQRVFFQYHWGEVEDFAQILISEQGFKYLDHYLNY